MGGVDCTLEGEDWRGLCGGVVVVGGPDIPGGDDCRDLDVDLLAEAIGDPWLSAWPLGPGLSGEVF